ncbi:MAG: DUF2953 domain-containing protein [Firmicutes bacterium]|nr:DUF2953 domain-containing protein [Bacillota bacterium]
MPSLIYILLLPLGLFFPVRFHLHYHQVNQERYFLLEMKLLGIYIWRYQLPEQSQEVLPTGTMVAAKTAQGPGLKEKSRQKMAMDVDHILTRIMDVGQALQKYGLGGTLFYLFLPKKYQRWVRVAERMEGKGRFTRLVWRSVLGKKDAAATSIQTGILWSGKGVVAGFLQKTYPFTEQPRIMVVPSFSGTTWETQLDSIFEIKLGHIIFAGMKEYIIEAVGGRKDAGSPD